MPVSTGLVRTLAVCVWLLACSAGFAKDAKGPFFEGLGDVGRKVTTDSPVAQRYFDQGLCWLYAFNHDEAIRSFQAAAEADPRCAMAWWGIALANGPHINNPVMTPERSTAAWEALDRARENSPHASEVEQALIEALGTRYAHPAPEDRKPLDEAYAAAMRELHERYPEDADIGAFCAESLMDLRPWDLWTADGQAQPGTEEIVATLERVIALAPKHPLALHLYIHTVEASPHRKRPTPPPTGCGTCSRGWGTWCTCPRTSTSAAAAGSKRWKPTRRRFRPTGPTARRRASRASTGSTWPTTITCFRTPR